MSRLKPFLCLFMFETQVDGFRWNNSPCLVMYACMWYFLVFDGLRCLKFWSLTSGGVPGSQQSVVNTRKRPEQVFYALKLSGSTSHFDSAGNNVEKCKWKPGRAVVGFVDKLTFVRE